MTEEKRIFENNGAKLTDCGIDEFWDRYGKPVSKKMWYVKVPHAHKTFYHKWFDSDVLGAQSVQGVYDQLNGLDNSCKFTEAEIEKYHLENCEKVPVDGSSK